MHLPWRGKASRFGEQHTEMTAKKTPSCLTFPLRINLSLPTGYSVLRYFVTYWQEHKWYLTIQPIKHATKMIFSSGLPYIQLQWYCSFAICLQPHPGFSDCNTMHMQLVTFCIFIHSPQQLCDSHIQQENTGCISIMQIHIFETRAGIVWP